jgi:hypothetical protein
MATRTGVLTITGNNSRLDDGTLLARCDATDPLSAATGFLRNQGFQSGDRIQVTGDDGSIGGVAVFCMTAAQMANQLAFAAAKGAIQAVAPESTKGKRARVSRKKTPKPKAPSPKKRSLQKSKKTNRNKSGR